MCDTSFNAIRISMNEIRMEQLVNKSNINYLSAKIESLERVRTVALDDNNYLQLLLNVYICNSVLYTIILINIIKRI